MSENMIFCIGEGKYESVGKGYQQNTQIFNKEVSRDLFDKTKSNLDVKNFQLPIAKWIKTEDMSKEEKKNITSAQTQMGGYLKTLSYEDAWAEMWENMDSSDKKFIQSLPNFNNEIFKEITGIKISKENSHKAELLKKADELILKANELKEKAENL